MSPHEFTVGMICNRCRTLRTNPINSKLLSSPLFAPFAKIAARRLAIRDQAISRRIASSRRPSRPPCRYSVQIAVRGMIGPCVR
jgi:hypothetical protein